MTLNLTGPISLAGATAGVSIAVELGQSATGTIALNDANVRTLAGVPTGAIVMPTNFYGKSSGPQPFGEQSYTTAGTYTFTVPTAITEICAVCVGGGAGGQTWGPLPWKFGGAGALSYSNGIPTTPGESLTVVVGIAGKGPVTPESGGDSYIQRGGSTLLLAQGGPSIEYGPGAGGQASSGVGAVRYSGGNYGGGNGGAGGGGAAGYSGNGGNGGAGEAVGAGSPGTGGGGGGGGGSINLGGRGGGVGIIVAGASGSGGNIASPGGAGGPGSGGVGQLYGGGGSSNYDAPNAGSSGSAGGVGAVRIIYGGTGKTYPNNSAP